jgi:multiple sugar transport system substrate-binding protein
VPGYDTWFNETYVKGWGNANGTEVIVDNVGLGDIDGLAAAEVAAQHGHDLVMLLAPPAGYEDQVIDHGEIYEECERQYGKVADFAIRSTYNPKTDRYFGFCESYAPALLTYRKDLWSAIGGSPTSWEEVLTAGRRIKLLNEAPVGISLAAEHNSEHTLRAITYSFGASVQDADGNPVLRSKAALEAIKYAKALYEQTMNQEVLAWDPSSNNRFMLSGEGSLTLDTISIARASENKALPVEDHLWLSGVPEGPAGRLSPSFGFYTYFIWNFAENVEGAKQFLIDYIGHSKEAFLASEFQNMPTFPGAVPTLAQLAANDSRAHRPDKYRVLAEAAAWTTNIGHPGHTNAAIAEVYAQGLIPAMYAQAATGQLTPEEALEQADNQVRLIFDKWKEAGKI